MAAKKCNYVYFPLVIFTIAATPVLAIESGSGEEICNGGIQQLMNCTESETVQRFYFDSSVEKCVEYTTCPLDSPRPNVFESMEFCKESCGDNTPAETGCPDLPPLQNGSLTKICQSSTCYALFSCERTHKLVGYPYLTCNLPDGRWSGSMPSCMAMSVYFDGAVVSNGDTVNPSEGTISLQFECKLDPKNIPDHLSVSQEWKVTPEVDTVQYFSSDKSAYILEVAGINNLEIGCIASVTSEFGQTVTLATTFFVTASAEAEAPGPIHFLPFSSVTDDQIRLRCSFSGKPKPNVLWYLNGKLVESKPPSITIIDIANEHQGATFSELTIQAPTESNYGQYTCNATNVIGKSSLEVFIPAPERNQRSIRSVSHDLCSLALQEQTAIFKGRLTRRQQSRSGDQDTYHLKIDAVIHSNNLPSAQTGSVLRVVTRLPLDTRRHQSTLFTVRTENGRIVLDSYQPYSKVAEKEIEKRCFE